MGDRKTKHRLKKGGKGKVFGVSESAKSSTQILSKDCALSRELQGKKGILLGDARRITLPPSKTRGGELQLDYLR
jgi:hypothetical protein